MVKVLPFQLHWMSLKVLKDPYTWLVFHNRNLFLFFRTSKCVYPSPPLSLDIRHFPCYNCSPPPTSTKLCTRSTTSAYIMRFLQLPILFIFFYFYFYVILLNFRLLYVPYVLYLIILAAAMNEFPTGIHKDISISHYILWFFLVFYTWHILLLCPFWGKKPSVLCKVWSFSLSYHHQ